MRKLLFLLPLLFLIISSQPLFANDSSGSAIVQTQTPSVDYTLDYPGLLPDNPLYTLKVIRDGLVGFFISDPLKKSVFDLLQADKRVNAGIYLSEESKVDEGLIVSTVSKGENYFSESIGQLDLAKKQGEVIDTQVGTLITAGKKHMQVLSDLEKKVSPKTQRALQTEIARVKNFENELVEIAKE